jgi:hypothetical protein
MYLFRNYKFSTNISMRLKTGQSPFEMIRGVIFLSILPFWGLYQHKKGLFLLGRKKLIAQPKLDVK